MQYLKRRKKKRKTMFFLQHNTLNLFSLTRLSLFVSRTALSSGNALKPLIKNHSQRGRERERLVTSSSHVLCRFEQQLLHLYKLNIVIENSASLTFGIVWTGYLSIKDILTRNIFILKIKFYFKEPVCPVAEEAVHLNL